MLFVVYNTDHLNNNYINGMPSGIIDCAFPIVVYNQRLPLRMAITHGGKALLTSR